jgi:hypothetical protein
MRRLAARREAFDPGLIGQFHQEQSLIRLYNFLHRYPLDSSDILECHRLTLCINGQLVPKEAPGGQLNYCLLEEDDIKKKKKKKRSKNKKAKNKHCLNESDNAIPCDEYCPRLEEDWIKYL